jgi:GTP-binding protein HflX
VLAELGLQDKRVLHVFNKIDLLEDASLLALQERMHNLLPNSIFVSTMNEESLEPLRRALLTETREQRPLTELWLPTSDGRLLAEVHRSGEVVEQRMEGNRLVLRVRLDAASLGRLRHAGAKVGGRTPA